MKKILVCMWLVCMVLTLQAQIPDDFLRVDPSEIADAKISQERTFTKESLFGYMNGGAELYLEYGFDRLLVSELEVKGKDLKVEVYRMPSVDMAFGIYSVNIFRCDDSDPLCQYYCQSDYQVQFHKGDYYVNIINSSGSSDGLSAAREIAKHILESIVEPPFDLDDYLPSDIRPENISMLMLVAGDVAVDNYAFAYADYLVDQSDYRLLIVKHQEGTILVVRSDNKDDEIIHIDSD